MSERNQGVKLVIFGAIGILVCGCGKGGNKSTSYKPKPIKKIEAAKVNPGEEHTLMPLKEGNQWVYKVNTVMRNRYRFASKKSEFTFRVAKVSKDSRGTKATLEVIHDDKVKERQVWLVKDTGIYQIAMGKSSVPYSSPKLILPFPIQSNKTFKWEGKGPSIKDAPMPIKLTGKIIGAQEVDTQGARLSAFASQTTERWEMDKQKGVTVISSWWAPGIGLARVRQVVATKGLISEQFLRLKSYQLK